MKKIIRYSLSCLLIMLSSACSKWIEVVPKTSFDDERMFATEQGFQETLDGVYLLMGAPDLYGRELTFGAVDVLGGTYSVNATSASGYVNWSNGLYTDLAVQAGIANIWRLSYNAIANNNKIIAELESADQSIFVPSTYQRMKGETLALRAFLHFDMLRLFGKSIAGAGADVLSIPYVKAYSTQINPRRTVKEVITLIKQDLNDAAIALQADPIRTTNDASRKLRLNYYAVQALLARVALWEGNNTEALQAAEKVIEVATNKFPWVTAAAVTAPVESDRDRTFVTEHIFALYVNKLAENYEGLLVQDNPAISTNLLTLNTALTTQYETATVGAGDYRRIYLVANGPTGTLSSLFSKLTQPVNMPVNLSKRIPLIRISEMYYIAAECLATTNPTKAIEYLTKVRNARGITAALAPNLTVTQINDEIRKEYRKEFPLEGQMFFYYKRKNSTSIPGIVGVYDVAKYVLPLPLAEIEYGQ